MHWQPPHLRTSKTELQILLPETFTAEEQALQLNSTWADLLRLEWPHSNPLLWPGQTSQLLHNRVLETVLKLLHSHRGDTPIGADDCSAGPGGPGAKPFRGACATCPAGALSGGQGSTTAGWLSVSLRSVELRGQWKLGLLAGQGLHDDRSGKIEARPPKSPSEPVPD